MKYKIWFIFSIVFINFSGDGVRISAIEFFKLCKLCKIYPVVITFEDLKKIVLKNKEFWSHHQMETPADVENARSKSRGKSNEKGQEPSSDNSFPFCEFVNAFRVSENQFKFANQFLSSYRLWVELDTPTPERVTIKCSISWLNICKSSLSNWSRKTASLLKTLNWINNPQMVKRIHSKS